jgi:hypothetical protein
MNKRMAARKSSPSPEFILMDHSPEVRHLAERLRNLICETVPEAVENAYPGWHAIGYRHPESGYFCAIFPQSTDVRLAFEWGVLLPDPQHLFSGNGKQVRFVDITAEGEILETAIRELLLAAVSLPRDRAFKLELIRQSARPVEVILRD